MTKHDIFALTAPKRGPQMGEATPCWYAFMTPPQKEPSARAWFEFHSMECWYPSETRWRIIPRGKRKKAPYEARIVPRYVFARFTGHPQWDILRDCRWLSRVIGIDGEPAPITDEALGAMGQVPQRLEAMRKAAAEAEAAARKARIIRPGDKARITTGAMEGWIVDVADIHAGVASFIGNMLGKTSINIPLEHLEKIQPVAKPHNIG
jgi:transcription antitermination factor NusG